MTEEKKSTKFSKGNPGKPKGAKTKVTMQLKEMILGALDKSGGEDYLVRQAEANPTAFLALIGKVLPTTLANDKDNPLQIITRVELVPMKSE